jgi:hypothetical protein
MALFAAEGCALVEDGVIQQIGAAQNRGNGGVAGNHW